MQRKLIALAVAGAFAVPGAALAQVTISGAFRFSVDAVKWNDGTAATTAGSGVSKWGMTGHSANIKFQSRESLGGGLTAWGVLESGLASGRTNAGNFAFNGRNSGVGLDSTSWGTVMFGLWDSPYKQLDGVWSIGTPAAYSYSATAPIFGAGDSTGSMPNPNCSTNESAAGYTITSPASVCPYSAASATAFQRRLSNVVQWWSPVWSGAQVLFAVQTNGTKANSTAPVGGTIVKADPGLWSTGLRWTGRNWGFIAGYEQHKNFNLNAAGTNRDSKDKGFKLGGNYNFGPATVSLAYEALKWEFGTPAVPTDLKNRNWSVGLAVPMGNGAIKSQWARSKASGSAAAGTNGDASMFNLSYEYNMSKRTLVYVAYAKLRQESASARQFGTNVEAQNPASGANLAGSDPRYISFGINHNF